MKNKVLLDYGFEERFYAVLIQSQQFDYQLAWSLNLNLNVKFRMIQELTAFNPKKKTELPHTLYCWTSPTKINYFLVVSPEKTPSLLSEMLLLIERKEHRENVERMIEKISAFDFIFFAEEITSKQQQLAEQLNHIVFDLEEHFDKLNKHPKYQPPKEEDPENI